MAESMRTIRRRIAGIEQTRQITNAMYLLSATGYKRTLRGMDYALQYTEALRRAMSRILHVNSGAGLRDIYMQRSEKGVALYMSVMGDKGLCGGYNNAVAALTAERLQATPEAKLVCFGRIGGEYLTRRGRVPEAVYPGSSMHPDLELAERLSKKLIDAYLTDEVNEVFVIYTPYKKTAREPVCFRLLPLFEDDFADLSDSAPLPEELLYEPSAEAVFRHIVPQYCAGLLYQFLIQSSACENAARMDAMQSATRNADEMLGALTARLNAVRQTTITNEITEIAASAALLKKGI